MLSPGSLGVYENDVCAFFCSRNRGGFGAGVLISVTEIAHAVLEVTVLVRPLDDGKSNNGADGEAAMDFQPSGDSTTSLFAGGRKGCEGTETWTMDAAAAVAWVAIEGDDATVKGGTSKSVE